ncbi:hypothetical protein RFI_34072, partial [Reticulomyxa filosa]
KKKKKKKKKKKTTTTTNTITKNCKNRLKSEETTMNIFCQSFGCHANLFQITGYDIVTLTCNGPYSCEHSHFFISNFSKEIEISAMADAVAQTKFVFAFGSYVYFTYFAEIDSNDLQDTYWSLTNIDKVDIDCFVDFFFFCVCIRMKLFIFFWIEHHISLDPPSLLCLYTQIGTKGYGCAGVTFDNARVKQFSVVCGGKEDSTGFNCYNTAFNNYEDTSFNLTCGLQYSCVDVVVRYDGSSQYDSSCAISCLPSPSLPTCDNVTIFVNNSALGFDDISLSCQ